MDSEQVTQLRIDIAEGFTGINTKLVIIQDNQQRLIDSIYGNGKEGIITKVARVETKQAIFSRMIFSLIVTFMGTAAYVIRTTLIT